MWISYWGYGMDIRFIMRRLFSKFKPMTIHVECAWDDKVWEQIKIKALQGKVIRWYVMTPTNYNYFKVNFNCKLSKKELHKKLVERYKWLIDNGQRLEAHIHFDLLSSMSYENQREFFESSTSWLKKYLPQCNFSELVCGWWKYNDATLKLCDEFGLKLVKHGDFGDMHDYDLIAKYLNVIYHIL